VTGDPHRLNVAEPDNSIDITMFISTTPPTREQEVIQQLLSVCVDGCSVLLNKKVSYRKQIARQHSWSMLQNIPYI